MDEVSRLFGIGLNRLRYWERIEFIPRSSRVGRRRYYTFQDLISIRAAKGLLARGIPLRSVRRNVKALTEALPRVARPLSSLCVCADGQRLVVRDDRGDFEPETGQLVLNFDVSSLRDDVVRVLRRDGASGEPRTAYDYYLEGCRLDEDENTQDQAEAAYRRAIELDASFANAFTNLGNLFFRRGDLDAAERTYHKALTVDPDQPEAHYDLGLLSFERGDLEQASERFEEALRRDPAFANAHFNLAMVLEELDEADASRQHWRAYLELDPDTPWADIARRHLKRD
jgi:DNA-binding transcriptional MerR regulator